MFPLTIEQLLSNEISENESDSDDEKIENIEDEGIYVVTLILITKLLSRTVDTYSLFMFIFI